MMTDIVLDFDDFSGLQKEKKEREAFTSENLENTQEVDPKDGGDLNIGTDQRDIDEATDDELHLDFTLQQKKEKKKRNINKIKSGIPIGYDGDDEEEEEDTKFDTVFDFDDFSSLQERKKRKPAFTSEDLENTQEVDPKDGGEFGTDERYIEAIDDKFNLDFILQKNKKIYELKFTKFPNEDADTKFDLMLKMSENLRNVKKPLRNPRPSRTSGIEPKEASLNPRAPADISTHTDKFLMDKLICCLQELKETADYTDFTRGDASNWKADEVLHLIYQAGIKNTDFSPEEKNTLGSLLSSAIEPIQINIECMACFHRNKLENDVLIKRSAIQFLIEEYAKFPVGDLDLGKELEESVEILNGIIDNFCNMNDLDDCCSDRESAGSEKVPPSHIWWLT